MPASTVSTRRVTVELVVAGVLLLATATLTPLGVAHWLLTLLPAAYPCGETYQVHPDCRVADPGAITIGHGLMIAVPVVCTLAGAAVAAGFALRQRHPVIPASLGAAIALVAFLTGQAMADAALADVVPW